MPPPAPQSSKAPAPPPGYTLDPQGTASSPSPPAGYTMDAPQQPQPAPTGIWAGIKRGGSNLVHLPGNVYDAFTKPPRNQDEQDALTLGGPGNLGAYRMFVVPSISEWKKAQAAQQQAAAQGKPQFGDPGNTGHPWWDQTLGRFIDAGDKPTKPTAAGAETGPGSPEHVANMHALAAAVPALGPISSDLTQRSLGIGQYQGQADPSGAAAELGTYLTLPKMLEKGVAKVPAMAKRAALLGKTPEAAYESAMKPSTTIPAADRATMASTGLQEGIPVSQKGLEKLSGLIDTVNDQIRQTIASDPTRPINPAAAVQNLRGVRQRFATQVNPASDLNAIDQSGQEFLDQFRSQPGGAVRNMTAEQAQAMKQGTYQALGDKAYGELKSSSIEAQKALARGLKDELAEQFPELKQLNARDSRLLDLQDSLGRAVNRIGNHQLIGIGTPIVAGAAKAMTGSGKVAAVAAVMKAVLDNPGVKSRLAIALSGGKVPSPVVMPKIASYYGLLSRAAQPQTQPSGLPFLPGSSQYPAQSPNQ